jgi:hypothetical protein
MRLTSLLTTLAITTSTAQAGANYIHNNCGFEVWLTSVGGSDVPEAENLPAGSYGSEGQYFDKTGTAIKITKAKDGIYTGAPVLHFSYSYKAGQELYYGLSTHAGFDFWGEKLTLGPLEGASGTTITWDGAPGLDYTASYLGGEMDLMLELCAKK